MNFEITNCALYYDVLSIYFNMIGMNGMSGIFVAKSYHILLFAQSTSTH